MKAGKLAPVIDNPYSLREVRGYPVWKKDTLVEK